MMLLKNKMFEKSIYTLLFISFMIVFFFLFTIIFITFKNSSGTLSLKFIFEMPSNGMTEGGILPMLVGTVMVTIFSAIFAIPFGIFCAIYLTEYAKDNFYTRLIKISIRNLSAVPSIVYGLFGLAIFVKTMHLGTSVISAGLTLGLLTLPTIISASEEALKNVPKSYKEGSYSLGLTKWQVLYTNVIPTATPGIITGVILGLSRAMGETAPILFTGAAFYLPQISISPTEQFMALPYHLYIMSTQHHDIEGVKGLSYSIASVLIILTLLLNIIASTIRYQFKKGLKTT